MMKNIEIRNVSKEIYELIKENPGITVNEIRKQSGFSENDKTFYPYMDRILSKYNLSWNQKTNGYTVKNTDLEYNQRGY